MKERLLEFLRNENKSSAQLADEIGVQASGISHILSGRNNPSLDFVLKMLEKYQFLSTEWLLFGKGAMYKEAIMQNLFDYEIAESGENDKISSRIDLNRKEVDINKVINDKTVNGLNTSDHKATSDVVKIVWFYEDNSFEEFFPKK
jgi:transcriptional regulator with XRE-family HTH domain